MNIIDDEQKDIMVTITLVGDLQTIDGERALECEIADSITVKQLIRKQGKPLRVS